mgnify:FL=1|nr:hypothetical protein [Prevotella sp.]
MHITIFRRRFTPWGVDGTMVINGVFFTGTVEHPKKFLSAGRYKIAPVPIRFQKKIEVEVKETDEEKEKNKKYGEKEEEKKFKIEIVEEVRTMPTILETKARVPKKPVLRKPYITPGFGPLALKYGSIVMGKSLKTGLVAYNEEKFQEFCEMIDEALEKKEKVTLVIKDWGKDEIPKEYMVVLPTNTPANYIRVNNNHK